MARNTLNAGIVGCGAVAPAHLDSYSLVDGVRVAALCDLDSSKLQALADRTTDESPELYTSFEEFLRHPGLDMISICTDHASHPELFLKAVQSGKHVMCEKPLAATSEGLDLIVSAAANAKVAVAGIFQHRFDGFFNRLKNVIQRGEFGEILTIALHHACFRSSDYYLDNKWRGTKGGEGGSLMINQSIHYVDILRWIFGDYTVSHAETANLQHQGITENEDCCSACLKFDRGSLGSYVATTASNLLWDYSMTVCGTNAFVSIENDSVKRLVHSDESKSESLKIEINSGDSPFTLTGSKNYYGSSHPLQIQDFVEAIRDDRAPVVSIAEAAKSLEKVFDIYSFA